MGRLIENRLTHFGVNPFSTWRIRPGAIDFWFENGQSAQGLISKFARGEFMAQIIGPHGSGKSTLLRELGLNLAQLAPLYRVQVRPAVKARFWKTCDLTCEPESSLDASKAICKGIFLIDGFDHLNWLARTSIRRFIRSHNFGLLITSHRDLKLPTLYESHSKYSSFVAVVRQLQHGFPAKLPWEQIRAAYVSCFPNLRDAMFQLYDRYEQQRRQRMRLTSDQ